MGEYICFNCKKKVQIENANIDVACPNCSGKILFKAVPKVVRTVRAR